MSQKDSFMSYLPRMTRQQPEPPVDTAPRKLITTIAAVVGGPMLLGVFGLGLAGILLSACTNVRKDSGRQQNALHQRAIHQQMVVFSANNNTFFPGLDNKGDILPEISSAYSAIANNKYTGASMSGRYYLLINGAYIHSNLTINPMESGKTPPYSKGMPSHDQFSYALLRIGMGPSSTQVGQQSGRKMEWRDTSNSQAILIADRNISPSTDPSQAKSVWSSSNGSNSNWQGTAAWGDGSAEFLTSALLGTLDLHTKYADTTNTADYLFNENASPGKSATNSAMFGNTHDNY